MKTIGISSSAYRPGPYLSHNISSHLSPSTYLTYLSPTPLGSPTIPRVHHDTSAWRATLIRAYRATWKFVVSRGRIPVVPVVTPDVHSMQHLYQKLHTTCEVTSLSLTRA